MPPSDYQNDVVEQPAQLTAYDPVLVGKTFFANLGIGTSLTNWMDQFNPVAVDHAQQPWLHQEAQGPLPMGGKETEQACALGQVGKQRQIISFQPAVKSAAASTF